MAKHDHDRIPLAALALGLGGLIPFVGTAVQVATAWPLGPRTVGPALYLMLTYGAVILSFMGGVQWGLAVAAEALGAPASWRRYGAAVVPALVAWLGLYLGARTGVLVVVTAFVLLLAYDLATVRWGEAPNWYGRLRAMLTVGAVACLLAAALLGPF